MEKNGSQPPPELTARDKRRFFILATLGCLIVILLWVATIPLNFRKRENTTAGPQAIMQLISDDISAGTTYFQDDNTTNEQPE